MRLEGEQTLLRVFLKNTDKASWWTNAPDALLGRAMGRKLQGATGLEGSCGVVAGAGGDFIAAHASGHIYTADLGELVTALNKAVIPVHTFEPQLIGGYFPNVRLLRDGEPFAL